VNDCADSWTGRCSPNPSDLGCAECQDLLCIDHYVVGWGVCNKCVSEGLLIRAKRDTIIVEEE
jgi:hypothetical protein